MVKPIQQNRSSQELAISARAQKVLAKKGGNTIEPVLLSQKGISFLPGKVEEWLYLSERN